MSRDRTRILPFFRTRGNIFLGEALEDVQFEPQLFVKNEPQLHKVLVATAL